MATGMRAQSILSSVIFVFGLFWAGVGDGDFSLDNFLYLVACSYCSLGIKSLLSY